jgi:predicted ABC-type ATPase
VKSIEAAIAKAAERVSPGGHNIPEATIRRGYKAGLCNCFSSYRHIVDGGIVFDAGEHHFPLLWRDCCEAR